MQKPGYQRIIARLEKVSCSHHTSQGVSLYVAHITNVPSLCMSDGWRGCLGFKWGCALCLPQWGYIVTKYWTAFLDCIIQGVLLIRFFFSDSRFMDHLCPHVDKHALKSKALILNVSNTTAVTVQFLLSVICSFIMGYKDTVVHHLLLQLLSFFFGMQCNIFWNVSVCVFVCDRIFMLSMTL